MTLTLTEWGLAFAVAHDLEVRPGNEGEVGPSRGFSLHVRGLEQGMVFRYDPEGRPPALLTWMKSLDSAMEPVMLLVDDAERGFLPGPEIAGYCTRQWKGQDRSPLIAVLEHVVALTQAAAIPLMPE
ncbi:MAG: hypothetical protein GEEBNDBF_01126 [bacterium]|nr:hypothetical protein [bacterium]